MTVTVSYTRDIVHPAFQSNSFTTDSQDHPSLLGTTSGEFVAAYNTNTTTTIALEWYGATQSGPSGFPRFPAQGPTQAVGEASLTQLHNGNVLVAWQENEVNDRGIRGRLYTADGTAVGNELMLVNITPDVPRDPEVAGLRDGGFALTYELVDDVLVALFNDGGAGSVLPGSSLPGVQQDPAIAALGDGGFVVTYTDAAGGPQVFARLYNADGSVRKADFLIDGTDDSANSKVAALPNGNWAAVWQDSTGGDGISLQIFNPAGEPIADVIHTVAANTVDPDITVLPNGFIVVGWTQADFPFEQSVYGRIFDQGGQRIALPGSGTAPFAFSNVGPNNSVEAMPVLAAVGPAGKLVTSWVDIGVSDGSDGRISSEVSQLVRHSTGDGADDKLVGDALNDIMKGGGGSDSFTARGGNNTIDGGEGIDTAVYELALANYEVYREGSQLIVQGPELIDGLTGIEKFEFADGTVNNADGSPLIDDLFYYSRNHDVWSAHADAEGHYGTFGWREGRDPNAWFDTSGYLAVNRDVAAAGINPLDHYHTVGWKEGRDPSVLFDTRRYLIANPDVAAAGVDPLQHYLEFGGAEGRATHRAVGPIVAGFDAQYYLFGNPDVAAAGVNPLEHFNTFGWREGRNPNPWFDTQAYLSHYADVAAAGVNPLAHYMTFGWKEGRDASDRFHTLDYLAANPDVAAAGVNPLEHFLTFGIYEHRSGVDYGLWN